MTDSVPTERIMLAAVGHAVFDGWVPAILVQGARDAGGTEADAARAFPGGVDDLIADFSDWADTAMELALAGRDLAGLRAHEKVALAVRLRLEALAPYRESVRRLNAHVALPTHTVLGARLVARTVDTIWYAAGDRSTDFSYYTKRGLLAGVYGATVLYWLSDESEGFADTWAFLDRRLADVGNIPRVRAGAARLAARFPNPLKIARLIRDRAI